MSSRYEQLRDSLAKAVAVDDVIEKTASLEKSSEVGYFDGLTDLEILNLKTIRSDIWRTRMEVALEQTIQQPV